jgi:hypothetical protein
MPPSAIPGAVANHPRDDHSPRPPDMSVRTVPRIVPPLWPLRLHPSIRTHLRRSGEAATANFPQSRPGSTCASSPVGVWGPALKLRARLRRSNPAITGSQELELSGQRSALNPHPNVSWLPCQCGPARAAQPRGSGHRTIACRTPGCRYVCYEPPHEPDPGGATSGRTDDGLSHWPRSRPRAQARCRARTRGRRKPLRRARRRALPAGPAGAGRSWPGSSTPVRTGHTADRAR